MAKKSSKKASPPPAAPVKDAEEIDDFDDSEFDAPGEEIVEIADDDEFEEEITESDGVIEEEDFEDDVFGSDDSKPQSGSGLLAEDMFDDLQFQEKSVYDEPFKHLSLEMVSKIGNVYNIRIYHQSHGFLSLLTTEILTDPDVEFCAYRHSSLDEPILKLIVKEGGDFRKILKNAGKRIKKIVGKIQEQIETVKI